MPEPRPAAPIDESAIPEWEPDAADFASTPDEYAEPKTTSQLEAIVTTIQAQSSLRLPKYLPEWAEVAIRKPAALIAEQVAAKIEAHKEKPALPEGILTFRCSRLLRGEVIFPRQLILERHHILTRKRSFPYFWIHREETIPFAKVGSIQLFRGLLWSTLVIENTGGVDPIIFRGMGNRQAFLVRDLVERRTSFGPENDGEETFQKRATVAPPVATLPERYPEHWIAGKSWMPEVPVEVAPAPRRKRVRAGLLRAE